MVQREKRRGSDLATSLLADRRPRVKAWREMPWLMATAAATILCLTCLQLFHSAMPLTVKLFLLIMTGVFATAFVVYSLVSTGRLLAQSLARSSRTP